MHLSLQERAPIYFWLSRLLVAEIDSECWAHLAAEPVCSLLGKLDPALADELSDSIGEARIEALREEFARLFLLPSGVPPFASAWLDGDREPLHGDIAALVTHGFEALSRKPLHAPPWGRLPSDHIALIFDLLGHAALSEAPDAAEIAAHLDQQLGGAWVSSFATALAAQAEEPLYRALGRLVATLHES